MQNAKLEKRPVLHFAFCILHFAFRPHVLALALLATLPSIAFAPALIQHEVFTARDHLDYFHPLRHFTAQELRAGNLPLWNPYNASGEPWLANPQTGVFYPPAWLFLVLPFATAYMLFLLFHIVLLGWGAYLFFARAASKGAAMVGAVALMFSGPVLSLLDINNNLATFAWIPLVLWCAAERAPVRGGFVLALAFLGGEPFFAAIAAVLCALVMPRVRELLVAAGVAIGVSAIQLFPFLALLAGSDRVAGMDRDLVLRESMPLRDWLRVAVPPQSSATGFDAALGQHFIPIIYMSVIAVLLALIGITRLRRAWPWLLLIAGAMIVAAGPSWLAQLPLTLFRYPARVVPLAALGVAALAVLGYDRIFSRSAAVPAADPAASRAAAPGAGAGRLRISRRDAGVPLLIVLLVADLLPRAAPLLRTAPFRTDVVPYARGIGADAKILRVGEIDPRHRPAWISGYLNLYDRRFDAYTAAPIANERYLRFHARVMAKPSRELLAAMPARYILTANPLQPPFVPIARPANATSNATMYFYPHAWPMAVLLARDAPVTPARLELGTSHARVIVDAPRDGMLVVTQQDAPGWRVTVDGEKRGKRLIFGVFRGVPVTKGRHEVLWTYRPASLFAGAATTAATLLALQVFLFVKRRRREKFFYRSLES